ncbi:MAG TPA: response regulator [Caproicibacter sp.]|nr:response regulator [Caproicibacter sp.]
MKVIIVDDEIKICQLINHLVDWSSMGMEVVDIVNDGKSAYESICKNHPDIVITDIRIPNYDGLELIRMCKEQFSSVYFIIISGYSEFEFAKSAIKYGVEDYLLKPIKKKELDNALKKIQEKYESSRNSELERSRLRTIADTARNKVKQSFLTRMVGYAKEEEFSEQMTLEQVNNMYQCNFRPGQFTIAHFHLFVKSNSAVKESLDFLVSKLQETVQEELSPCCEELICAAFDSSAICLMNTSGENLQKAKKQLHKIKLAITNELFSNISLIIGVGNSYADISKAAASYREAERAILNRFSDSQQYIFEYSGIQNSRKTVSDFIDLKNRNDLIAAQERMDVNAILTHIHTLKQRLTEFQSDSKLVYDCLLELIEILQFGSKNYDVYFQKFDLDESKRKIGSILTFDGLFEWIKNDIINKYQDFANQKKVAEKKPIRIAKQYIYDNYNKNLTLESVSEHIGFNATYFSVFFKKETGKNFSEYLMELRIKNAKLYLISTDMDLADIAEEVGYSDLKYFSKLFKKATGINPSEYRKLYG